MAPEQLETTPLHAVTCWIGLGSNMGDPEQQLRGAMAALQDLADCQVTWRSRLYRTQPVGGPQQPDFINAVARMVTTLAPLDLLRALHQLETQAGRQRRLEVYWGPRILDLDLLIYGDAIVHSPTLTLPHPRLHERAFVLLPLAEYDPQLRIPGAGCVNDHLPATVHGQGIKVLADDRDQQEQPRRTAASV